MGFAKKVVSNYYIWLGLVVIISSMSPILTYLGLAFIFLFSLYINFIPNKLKNNIQFMNIFIVLILFQNILIGIGAHLVGNVDSSLKLLTQIPTIFIFFVGLKTILEKKWTEFDVLFFVFILFCVALCFVGASTWSVRLVYLRNFTIFYFIFVSGKKYLNDITKLYRLCDFVIILGIVAGVFGIIGVIMGKPFYEFFGVQEVYIAKAYKGFVDGMPGNFFTLFNGHRVNRLASFYLEPVNFSYFMAFTVIASLFRKKYISFGFLLICNFLTFGKGGMLLLTAFIGSTILSIILLKLFKLKVRSIKWITSSTMLVGIVSMGVLFYYFLTKTFGAYMHFYGIITAIKAIIKWPLGYGIGTAGNVYRMNEGTTTFDISETGLANMGYQIGIIGLIIFILLMIMITNQISKYLTETKFYEKNIFAFGIMFLPVIIIFVSIFQENTLGTQCILPYMLLCSGLSRDFSLSKKSNRFLEKINDWKGKLIICKELQ